MGVFFLERLYIGSPLRFGRSNVVRRAQLSSCVSATHHDRDDDDNNNDNLFNVSSFG